MKRVVVLLIVILITGMILQSCEKTLPKAPSDDEVLAGMVPGLSSEQQKIHLSGDVAFADVFSKQEGLGPIFVQASCESCHSGDGKGSPFNNLIRFGKYNANGRWDPMLKQGGPQLQHRAITGYSPEKLPAGAQSSEFMAPNVTGLGYLSAVTDEYILQLVDSLDLDGDGISGTINFIKAPAWLNPDERYHIDLGNSTFIGRFGRKAAAIDLLHQTVGAYKQDMGITSIYDPIDPVNPLIAHLSSDEVPDPEVDSRDVNNVVFYLQTLKVPPRRNKDDSEVKLGEQYFNSIGCASCHMPEMKTGPSEIAALNYTTFYPYTDMLLHDLGFQVDDGYTEGTVKTSEWRTTPLWGLGLQKDSQGGQIFLMHDGRAHSYHEAILLHGGEAVKSKTAYNELSESEKNALFKFLDSL